MWERYTEWRDRLPFLLTVVLAGIEALAGLSIIVAGVFVVCLPVFAAANFWGPMGGVLATFFYCFFFIGWSLATERRARRTGR